MSNNPIFTDAEWSPEVVDRFREEARRIGEEELGLDIRPMQIEIIDAERMLDLYTSQFPINYHHWSFGKHFLRHQRQYQKTGNLSYEMVINSDPCILYCMEDNSMPLQGLVVAHAGVGHNAVFNMNYYMNEWANPRMILDYMDFARNFISGCEEKYGVEEVEVVLDACHALWLYGVDRYKHPRPFSLEEEKERHRKRAENRDWERNLLWDTLPEDTRTSAEVHSVVEIEEDTACVVREPQENILYFLEKQAPHLPEWKREIIRIVRKMAQHLFPQMEVKLMNEGFATFVHYYVMNRLREDGLVNDAAFQEFLRHHTNVIFQPEFDETITVFAGYDKNGKSVYKKKSIYTGKNVYALGFKIFQDIKRMCESPTQEDYEWFPYLAGSSFPEALRFAVQNFRDESFVLQFLSPKVMRDFHLFSVLDDDRNENLVVTAIHQEDGSREEGYRHVRRVMASEYKMEFMFPRVEVVGVNTHSDRKLHLKHQMQNRRVIDHDEANKVLNCVKALWEFQVQLEMRSPDEDKKITLNK